MKVEKIDADKLAMQSIRFEIVGIRKTRVRIAIFKIGILILQLSGIPFSLVLVEDGK